MHCHLGLVISAEEEEDGLTDTGDAADVAGDRGEPVDEPVAGQELATAHGHQKPLQIKVHFFYSKAV